MDCKREESLRPTPVTVMQLLLGRRRLSWMKHCCGHSHAANTTLQLLRAVITSPLRPTNAFSFHTVYIFANTMNDLICVGPPRDAAYRWPGTSTPPAHYMDSASMAASKARSHTASTYAPVEAAALHALEGLGAGAPAPGRPR